MLCILVLHGVTSFIWVEPVFVWLEPLPVLLQLDFNVSHNLFDLCAELLARLFGVLFPHDENEELAREEQHDDRVVNDKYEADQNEEESQ